VYWFKLVLIVGAGLLAAAIAAGFLGRFHPAFDSFAHFRLHLAVALALAAFALAAFDVVREGIVGLALAIGAFVATPGTAANDLLNAPARAAATIPDRPVYRLLQYNARFDNKTPEELLRLVARYRPDVVTMEEVSTHWRARIASLSASYPHQLICDTRSRVGGVAILSRRPFADDGANACLDEGSLGIAAIDFGGQTANVAALHLHWPWPYPQMEQVGLLSESLATLGETAILAGDFNAARWSATVRAVELASGLDLAGSVGPTWLARQLPPALRPYAGLGIDHILAGPRIKIHSLARGDFIGSDHLPVLFEFSIEPPPLGPDAREIVSTGSPSAG
ncbi:MAG: endonuclease/exonuclease/phosphatase family protein, partial [Mesorhizobium sp.]